MNIFLYICLGVVVCLLILIVSYWQAHREMTSENKLARHELSSDLSRFKNEFGKITGKFYASSRFRFSLFVDYNSGNVWVDNQIHANMFILNGCMYKFGFFDYLYAMWLIIKVYNKFVLENKFEPNDF